MKAVLSVGRSAPSTVHWKRVNKLSQNIQTKSYIIVNFIDKCYTLGNFDLTQHGTLIEFTSIEKEPLTHEFCKRFLKGHTRDHYKDFVCTNFRAEEKVRSILI